MISCIKPKETRKKDIRPMYSFVQKNQRKFGFSRS